MAIYHISELKAEERNAEELLEPVEPPVRKKDFFLSAFTARLFFLILLFADLLWVVYASVLLIFNGSLQLICLGKIPYFKKATLSGWLKLKRALVCAVSLCVALFSPAFGIMIACTYFLTYDKAGLEEVVPSSLQAQFNRPLA